MPGRVAIVGSGLAALAAHATLRHGGVADVTVFGTHADPTAQWRERAAAIRQQRMRSESDGHLAPASFPGLAVREAARRGSVRPLLASVANRYHPTVEDFLAHADEVRERTRWDDAFVQRRVERVRAVDGGFELDGEGPFAHVLLALGHPGLERLPGAVHAYEPHDYAQTVAVVGAGMAAATEWLNALAAGSEVVSVRRSEPLRRPLNVPRPLFTKRGLAAFHAAAPERRAAVLRELSAPSYPEGAQWDEPLAAAAREGRFRVEPHVNGAEPSAAGGADCRPGAGGSAAGASSQVICATGFKRGYVHDPLLRALVDDHGLETRDRWIVLAPDSTVPRLTGARRTLSLAGVAGQWAFPAADTVAGAKYAARAFASRCRTR